MMSVCLSLSLLVCVSSLLVSIPLVRAQESFCKTKLGNADKSKLFLILYILSLVFSSAWINNKV